MSRVPVARSISLLAVLPQIAALGSSTAGGIYALGLPLGALIGAGVYVAYSTCSRVAIPRAHRRGMRLVHAGQFDLAILEFEESNEFFTRHAWLDRFRSIVMMCPSAMSYRELALCNIGFCYSQLGNGQKAEQYYRRALKEFPESVLAAMSLRFIESVRQQSKTAK